MNTVIIKPYSAPIAAVITVDTERVFLASQNADTGTNWHKESEESF